MKIHVFCVPPIDFWIGWLSERQFIDSLHEAEWAAEDQIEKYPRFLMQAKKLAGDHLGWQGDVSDGPYISAVPSIDARYAYDRNYYYMIGWKQNNNGITFIASEVFIPRLGNSMHTRHVVR